MNHDLWLELAEMDAAGALDGPELRDFHAHLASGCAECEQRMLQTGEALALFSKTLPQSMPSAQVKAALMQQIASSAPATPRHLPSFALAASLAGVALLAFGLFTVIQGPQKTSTAPENPVHDKAMLEILSSPDLEKIVLKGLAENTGIVSGQMAWNPEAHRGCFTVKGLKPLPSNKTFQLWAIGASGAPISVGTFSVDKDGCAHVDFPALKETISPEKFAVTVEPAGGVPQPTGSMALLGTV